MTNKVGSVELQRRTFFELMKNVGTSIPGYILSFNTGTQLAQLQIGIVRKDTEGKSFNPAPLIECPVQFSGGGGHACEHQLDPGDEGIIVFSQRCIDGWVNTGGIANNPIMRFHNFSDAYFIPGIRSQPNKITGFQNDGIRMRNQAGDKYVWLKSSGDVEISGNAVSIISDSLTHNGVNIGDDHNHPYSWTDPAGSGNTGGPQ